MNSNNSGIISTQVWNGLPEYYTTTIDNNTYTVSTSTFPTSVSFDEVDDGQRKPIRANREVGEGLAEMINGDL